MAIIAYPLNNIEYTAEDAMLMNIPVSSGVLELSDNLDMTLTGNLTASISTGVFFMRLGKALGFTGYNNSAASITFAAAHASLPRIDRVVLQYTASANRVSIVIKQGTAASSPIAPERSQTQSVYELVLYDVYRPAASTAINVANITDQRGNPDLCGKMANSLSGLDDYLLKSGGVMNGLLKAQNNTNYSASQVRNVILVPNGTNVSVSTADNGTLIGYYE